VTLFILSFKCYYFFFFFSAALSFALSMAVSGPNFSTAFLAASFPGLLIAFCKACSLRVIVFLGSFVFLPVIAFLASSTIFLTSGSSFLGLSLVVVTLG